MYIDCKIIDNELISIKIYDLYFLEERVEQDIEYYGYSTYSNLGVDFNIIVDLKRIDNIKRPYIKDIINKVKNTNFYKQYSRKEKLKRLQNVSKEK